MSLIDGKLKDAGETVTREQLVEHCRLVIKKQRPSSTVNEVVINGAMVGRQGDNMIIHEHVMRMMNSWVHHSTTRATICCLGVYGIG